ncbi:PREDICTED: probable cytochrome P450 6a14 isoform X2 [Eufriesea mexicana]|nr:PREDICTED: probable cytochrome P450 6a14 isoform X2 [Eufriesea mexicana]
MEYFQIACGIAAVVLAIYYYYKSIYNTWKSRGIPGPKPTFLLGNFVNIVIRKQSMSDKVREWYDEFKHEPVFGIFQGTSPALVINDLDMVKDVLIRDFSSFVNRGFRTFPKVEPMAQNLFTLESEKWRTMRTKLSPIFTSGKLKEMFSLIVECAENFDKHLAKTVGNGEPVEFHDLAAKFTTDVIGSCAFGINMNALKDENSEFRQMGRKISAPSVKRTLKESCKEFTPWLYERIGHLLEPKEMNDFFTNIITGSMKYRRENNVIRPDFVHLLMELQDHPDKLNNIELTDSLLTAQALVFFVAGFETSSSTIAHALYELAQHQDIQDKLREEIKEVTKENIENLTYNDMKEMKYLDMVFKETLRKYPLLPMLPRQAVENYTFRGTKLTIPKGTNVWIPVIGIQRDPNIYPEPEVFDPERFTEEAVAARHPMSYLPFGDGPRNCIGARFAHYQTKIGIITVISNYKVVVCEKTRIPFESNSNTFLLRSKDGVNLKIERV